MPCSLSSWTIELNALPEGSRPTLSHSELPTRRSASASVKTFDTDWIEKGSSASPDAWTVPSGSASAKPSLRSEEHTSELQSLMRISYAVFCLKKNKKTKIIKNQQHTPNDIQSVINHKL